MNQSGIIQNCLNTFFRFILKKYYGKMYETLPINSECIGSIITYKDEVQSALMKVNIWCEACEIDKQ